MKDKYIIVRLDLSDGTMRTMSPCLTFETKDRAKEYVESNIFLAHDSTSILIIPVTEI